MIVLITGFQKGLWDLTELYLWAVYCLLIQPYFECFFNKKNADWNEDLRRVSLRAGLCHLTPFCHVSPQNETYTHVIYYVNSLFTKAPAKDSPRSSLRPTKLGNHLVLYQKQLTALINVET